MLTNETNSTDNKSPQESPEIIPIPQLLSKKHPLGKFQKQK